MEFGISCTDHSQSSIDDDGVCSDWEAKNSGVFWRVSECDLLAFCIFFWEKADFRNAVILERQKTTTKILTKTLLMQAWVPKKSVEVLPKYWHNSAWGHKVAHLNLSLYGYDVTLTTQNKTWSHPSQTHLQAKTMSRLMVCLWQNVYELEFQLTKKVNKSDILSLLAV